MATERVRRMPINWSFSRGMMLHDKKVPTYCAPVQSERLASYFSNKSQDSDELLVRSITYLMHSTHSASQVPCLF